MCAVAPHLPLLSFALSCLLITGGCYDALDAPTTAPPLDAPAPAPPAERPVGPSAAGTGASAATLAQLGPVLARLETDVAGSAARPGAEEWRPAELQKLRELAMQLCGAGAPSCRAAMVQISAAQIPGDELLTLLGSFMGALRSHAEVGFGTLGRRLLTDPVGRTRDLAFRMAVGSGLTRRGEPDADGRRATLVPASPPVGDPAVLLVEIKAICNEVTAQQKGPDLHGRIDLVLRPACDGQPEPEIGPDGFPRAVRAVWAVALDALPDEGVVVHVDGGVEPLLQWRPPVGPVVGK